MIYVLNRSYQKVPELFLPLNKTRIKQLNVKNELFEISLEYPSGDKSFPNVGQKSQFSRRIWSRESNRRTLKRQLSPERMYVIETSGS